MFQTLKNAWKIPELRKKILFTLLIVLLYRLGACLPVPYVNPEVYTTGLQSQGIFELLNIMSGGAFGKATLFALSVSPYITASIVMQPLSAGTQAAVQELSEIKSMNYKNDIDVDVQESNLVESEEGVCDDSEPIETEEEMEFDEGDIEDSEE